jgi:transcriptional regulator with XRE-family HTH domain
VKSYVDGRRLAESVGHAIARGRVEAEYTQTEVAEKPGPSRSAIARVKQGISIPTVARLVELSELFACRADNLLVDDSARPNDQTEFILRLFTPSKPNERQLLIKQRQIFAQKLAGR